MQLNQVNIDGFGVWRGLRIEELSPTVTVFFGHNEAGKSTLLNFLRTMLYGIDLSEERRYLPPVNGGQPGGSLNIRGTLGRFQVVRLWDERTFEENAWIVAPDGSRQSRTQLEALLEGVDRYTYNNIFAVGLREIQLLATLDDSHAAQKIYELTSGLDRISLAEVVRRLEISREALISHDGADCIIDQLLDQHVSLKKEVEEQRTATQQWGQVLQQQRSAAVQIEQQQQKSVAITERTEFIELAEDLRSEIERRESLTAKIDEAGEIPDVAEESLNQLNQLRERVARRKGRCTELRSQYKALFTEHESIPLNRELSRHAARVDALGEQRHWIVAIRKQISGVQEEIEDVQREIEAAWENTGVTLGQGRRPDLTPKQLKSLKAPMQTLEQEIHRHEESKRTVSSHEDELESAQTEVDKSLANLGEDDLSVAIDKAGELVNLLRRRIQVEEKIDKLEFQRREAEIESADLLENQILPRPLLALLGLTFSVGVLLILLFIFGAAISIPEISGTLPLFGCVFIFGVIFTKVTMERSVKQNLSGVKRQFELVNVQLHKAVEERDEFDQVLPKGGGPLVARLQSAEDHLAHLEGLIPLGNRAGEAKQKSDYASKTIQDAEHAVNNARRRWRDALRALDLPDDLQPDRIKVLARILAHIHEKRKDLKSLQDQEKQRTDELHAVESRITQLAGELGLKNAKDGLEQLDRLQSELERQQNQSELRTDLRGRAQKIKDEFKKTAGEMRKAAKQRQEILDEAGVEDEEGYRKLLDKANRINGLLLDLEEVEEKIVAKLGAASLETVEEFLAELSAADAEKELAELLQEFEQTQRSLKEGYERSGELKAQLESLEENDRLCLAQLELNEVSTQIEQAIERWQSLAVTANILDQIRRIYETQRQPETLKMASIFMEKLSLSKYVRIWTPLSENTLYVEDAKGRSKSLEHLSEGTREQVFLSVRLALVRTFARQGRVLPVILDDVMVNFDSKRCKATAEVLMSFANEGHQTLVFTCHEHIMEIFQNLGGDVRVLPQVTGVCRPEPARLPAPVAEEVVEEVVEPEPIAEEPIIVPPVVKKPPFKVVLPIIPYLEVYPLTNSIKPKPKPVVEEDLSLADRGPIVEPESLPIQLIDAEYYLERSEHEEPEPVFDLVPNADYQLKDAAEVDMVSIALDDLWEEPEPSIQSIEIPLPVVALPEVVDLVIEVKSEPEPQPEMIVVEPEPEPTPPKRPLPSDNEFGWDSPKIWWEGHPDLDPALLRKKRQEGAA
ncbi:AAA family ATPase [Blastopirellula sp. J2-11]|uniref:AAA family ATPase n=1 Tax=Blastopirellula sp. J2-11 TaxID=2943192 RepID=UPI0021C9C7CD|nr:AAA family ATPase [Blastopirellula sp. J2-11]UUO05046.1 AAA family ATPase [Blastopirellula sp. J2-11]